MNRLAAIRAALLALGVATSPAHAAELPLTFEAKIPLGNVKGRIDHMAVDAAHNRLLVAELGNDSLGIVDLAQRKVLATVRDLAEPQGVAYDPASDAIFVANARDGSLRVLSGADFAPVARIDLGDDADNLRLDAAARRLFIGYGRGALAVIELEKRQRLADLPLKRHPESFQLDPSGRIFVNVPEAHEIAVLDRKDGKQSATWRVPELQGNFPMALVNEGKELAVVFRNPAKLATIDAAKGTVLATTETCGDADDVFEDAKRERLYVICGEGYVDVFERDKRYFLAAHVKTAAGARTGYFLPSLDRLYVGVRGTAAEKPAIWVFKPGR
jgi:hypothetical protein